jgi:hypothetical protein
MQQQRSALARVFAVWHTGLPRPMLILHGGNALNTFGTGLLLPFEIIYLHAVRRLLRRRARTRTASGLSLEIGSYSP